MSFGSYNMLGFNYIAINEIEFNILHIYLFHLTINLLNKQNKMFFKKHLLKN